jgi:Protein of unknown function (DUF4012)
MDRRIRLILLIAAVFILVAVGSVRLLSRSLPPLLDGIAALQVAGGSVISDPAASGAGFASASQTLRGSLNSIRESGPLAFLSVLPPLRWQVRLAKASTHIADAGLMTSTILTDYHAPAPTGSDVSATLAAQSATYFSWYDRHGSDLDAIQREIDDANDQLSGIPPWIFLSRRDEFNRLRQRIADASTALPLLRSTTESLATSFGKGDTTASPHHFLVLFQNDAELRPSGGFIGSYGVLTASSGTLRSFAFGTNIYKIDVPFARSVKVEPPAPLKTITQYWAFRDSTVGSGFRADASRSAADMYKKETGTDIDGALLLDTSVLQDMLRLSGPIAVPGSDTSVDASSVVNTLTETVEKTYYESDSNRLANEPKSIIGALIPILIDAVRSTPGALRSVPNLVRDETARKSIQLWLSDSALDDSIARIQPTDAPVSGNWMKVVNTNIGGMKSSPHITQRVEVSRTAEPLKRCIVQTVTITRTHTGSSTWPDGDNNNFMEVYLPSNADVLSLPQGRGGASFLPESQQVEIGTLGSVVAPAVIEGANWKKVAFWATTAIGATTEYTFSYALPAEDDGAFTYLKQAGARNETLDALGYDGPVAGNLTLVPIK